MIRLLSSSPPPLMQPKKPAGCTWSRKLITDGTETDNRRGPITGGWGITGGWRPIENISDPHVKEIAEFAVSEYNKQAKGQNKLAFERVVRGDTQLVAGMNYRLVISAKNKSVADPDDATPAEYEGIVWERTWLHFKQLTSFHRLSNPN
ncbi:unnamed protein product [Malus baccata var. baccata]